MGEVKTVERTMTDRERALAVLLEIAEDAKADAPTRLKAAEIVIASTTNPKYRPSLSPHTQLQAC